MRAMRSARLVPVLAASVFPGVPKIVEVETGQAEIGHGLGPLDCALEVRTPQFGAFAAGEDQSLGLVAGEVA